MWSIIRVAVIGLAATLPTLAAAEKAAIRPEFEVSMSGSYTYYGYVYPDAHPEGRASVDIAASSDGTFVVVWEDLYTYGGGYYGFPNPGVWMRRFDSLGRVFGPERRVSPLSSYARGGVAVASDPLGRFVVVWDDYNAGEGESYQRGIRAQPFNSQAGEVGLPVLVNTYTTGDQFTPKVAMDGSGNFVVVWVDPGRNPYPYYGYSGLIEGQRFDSAGNARGNEFQVNSAPGCYKCAYSGWEGPAVYDDMDVAAAPAGSFMVVWNGAPEEYAYRDIFARVFDSAGAAVAPEFVVNTYTTGDQSAPSVAADGSGRFVVVWTDIWAYHGVRARRFDSTGSPLGDEFQVENDGYLYGFTYGPSVAADATGNFVVTWEDQFGGGVYGIYGREFDATAAPVGDQFRVDLNIPGDFESQITRHNIAASGAGEFVVAFGQYAYYSYYPAVYGRQLGEKPVPCTSTPKAGCRLPSKPGRGVFLLKRSSRASRNLLRWRWVRGQEVTVEDLGDPIATDSYALCVYDASARLQPLMDFTVPAGGGCGKVPCWRPIGLAGTRFDYLDKARFVGGMELLRIGAKPEGRARVTALARKEELSVPSIPLTAPVTVQLQAANGTCWSADYGAFIKKNADGVFKAKPD